MIWAMLKDAAEIIYELSNILEMPEAKNKKICLKLGDIDLSSISIIEHKIIDKFNGFELAFVDTNSEQTELSALNLGIIISELSNEIEVPEMNLKMKNVEIKEHGNQENQKTGFLMN